MKKRTITIQMKDDVDARPVAMLVQVTSQFDSSVHIESGDKYVNAKSIMGMMALSLTNGEEITVIADGIDENAAIDEIEKYLSGQE